MGISDNLTGAVEVELFAGVPPEFFVLAVILFIAGAAIVAGVFVDKKRKAKENDK